MRNIFQIRARQILRRLRQHENDPKKRDDLFDAIDQMNRADHVYEKWIEEAKMIGVRNPAFDGDMVGWLDDDFDDDEDDEQKKRKPR